MGISWDAVNWVFVILPVLLFVLASALVIFAFLAVLLKAKSEKTSFFASKTLVPIFGTLGVYLLFAVGFLGIAGLSIFQARGPWDIKDKGIFDHIEYTDIRGINSHGGPRISHKTIIHFSDGHTAILPGEYAIEFSKGTPIKVMTKNYFYKIVKDQ